MRRTNTMDSLPEDVIRLLLAQIRDSREIGLTCRRIYAIYSDTPDAAVFRACGRGCLTPLVSAGLYSLFSPLQIYICGSAEMLQALWRSSVRVKRAFLGKIFDDPNAREISESAKKAEWLWNAFRDELLEEDRSYIDDIAIIGHYDLLEKIVAAVEYVPIETFIFDNSIDDFRTFKLIFHKLRPDFEPYGDIRKHAPTNKLTYASIHGMKLIEYNTKLFAEQLGLLRAIRLDDVYRNYKKLLSLSKPASDVRDWLLALKRD